METILKILKDVFLDNYIALLILCLGWIPLLYLKIFIDWVGPILLLRIPFYVKLLFLRRRNNIPQLKKAILTEDYRTDHLLLTRHSLITLIINFDAISSSILLNQKPSIINLFPLQTVGKELRWINDNYISTLESNLAIFESFLEEPKLRYSGILNLANNQSLSHKESFDFLKLSLKSSDKKFRIKTFYIIQSIIKDQGELVEIEQITENWPKHEKNIISNELVNLKLKLEPSIPTE